MLGPFNNSIMTDGNIQPAIFSAHQTLLNIYKNLSPLLKLQMCRKVLFFWRQYCYYIRLKDFLHIYRFYEWFPKNELTQNKQRVRCYIIDIHWRNIHHEYKRSTIQYYFMCSFIVDCITSEIANTHKVAVLWTLMLFLRL